MRDLLLIYAGIELTLGLVAAVILIVATMH
jgi:hypothetical protein